ncbi:hypothetical protein H4696_004611 [Amycolatopsis lexingtonensis]|uniref:DUF8017 domain-containing protein n=1 Tax=Amycolatopsis lexingtonensis TaxID=218822 RepID=A0ABR9I2U5_9PSEU|nr:hypothetical protein [Amycolatopsis lexingtonensis]MBE1497511.1 hypothetical protein [Amycolatopsis lexingtonensis]
MARFRRRPEDETPGYEDNAALRGFGGYEPADAPEPPRARPKRIRPAAKPLKWRRAPWFGLVFIALVAGVLNALGVGKPRDASSSPTPRTPVVVTPSPRAEVPAVVTGWRSVAGRDGSYAYDVPPSWAPEPGTLHGWDKTGAVPGLRLITSAFLGEDFCGDSNLGGAGVTTEPLTDLDAAARKAVTDLGMSAFSPDNGPLAAVTADAGTDAQLTKADGTKAPARIVVAEVVPTETGECAAKHALVAAMAFGGNAGTAGVVVAYADSDRGGPSVRDDLVGIVRSYRFVPAADRSTTTPPPTTYR